MRKKWHTVLWTIFFGWLGFHRFYLGQKWRGIGNISIAVLAIISIAIIDSYRFNDDDLRIYFLFTLIFLPLILWFIDIVSFLFITKLEFRAKYGMQDLKYMNSLEQQAFLQKNSNTASALPEPDQNNFNNLVNDEVQEKIARYGRLYEEGMLTKEEFLSLKKSLKNNF